MELMTEAANSRHQPVLSRVYASALREYVSGAGETALKTAYELGRTAFNDGIGILDMAMVHHQALGNLLAEPVGAAEEFMARAADFFTEAISTFEMTMRSYQANARLLGLSEVLARQNAESDRAYEQLRTILDATTA